MIGRRPLRAVFQWGCSPGMGAASALAPAGAIRRRSESGWPCPCAASAAAMSIGAAAKSGMEACAPVPAPPDARLPGSSRRGAGRPTCTRAVASVRAPRRPGQLADRRECPTGSALPAATTRSAERQGGRSGVASWSDHVVAEVIVILEAESGIDHRDVGEPASERAPASRPDARSWSSAGGSSDR